MGQFNGLWQKTQDNLNVARSAAGSASHATADTAGDKVKQGTGDANSGVDSNKTSVDLIGHAVQDSTNSILPTHITSPVGADGGKTVAGVAGGTAIAAGGAKGYVGYRVAKAATEAVAAKAAEKEAAKTAAKTGASAAADAATGTDASAVAAAVPAAAAETATGVAAADTGLSALAVGGLLTMGSAVGIALGGAAGNWAYKNFTPVAEFDDWAYRHLGDKNAQPYDRDCPVGASVMPSNTDLEKRFDGETGFNDETK